MGYRGQKIIIAPVIEFDLVENGSRSQSSPWDFQARCIIVAASQA